MRCQTLPWHVSTAAYILPQKCDWHAAELRLAMSSGEENPRYEVDRGFHEKWHSSLWHEDFIWFHICHKVCEPVVLTSCGGLWHQGGVLLFLPGLLRSSVRAVRFGLSGQLRPMESSADKRQVSDISDDASEKKFSHVKVRIKMYLWSCQEEGCRMFVDYQPDCGQTRCRSLLLYLDNIVVFSSNIENIWRGCIAWRWQPQRPWF